MAESIHEQIERLTDEKLLDWLSNGKEELLDDGRRVRRQLNAAEMKVVITRLQQLGLCGAGRGSGTSASDGLVEAAKRKFGGGMKFDGRKVPPLSTDDDAATGTNG